MHQWRIVPILYIGGVDIQHKMKGKDQGAQMAMCQGMLDQHMATMQMMMDGQIMGMAGGMGPGMGGMMSK
ncbi:hypothetical protein [Ralstonia solanacearum]|uniref:Uncharacterized protein n=1 Tax=Ralstonia solanacearum TaxID=305 RepID=A0A5H2PS43_RALSL|nr:hypothetical protein [Ralstonia solanacearum]AMP72109.1 hypothetical protein UW163_21970 [Ralstonia solanacearum]AMP76597.1 hypothetical protein RALBFv3_20830 [Ralstonia solanacearum]AYB62507.1 hypothetical protein C2124_18325 [Ralstonia solanacearum]EUJ13005.1 hypothetical protein RSP673_18205 [Ralstonia solanacearum P673]MBB6589289.1 hypothetical protein [Ralstonia solanacearum]